MCCYRSVPLAVAAGSWLSLTARISWPKRVGGLVTGELGTLLVSLHCCFPYHNTAWVCAVSCRRLVPVWDVPVEHSFASRSKTRQGFLKSFVDLFMLSMADTAFLTNWSLFGRAALEIGLGGDEDTRFYINDSQCGQPGHVMCYHPLVPDVCNHVHSDEL
jgi:hypothetical protein